MHIKLLIFLLEHASFTHSLVSIGLPLQLFPEVHLLVRLSVPRPHVTEHDQRFQIDQTSKVTVHEQPRIKLLLTSCNVKCLCKIAICFHKPGQDLLLQIRACSEFPSQLFPEQLLLRISVPEPQVTEQVHDVHNDQATKLFVKLLDP